MSEPFYSIIVPAYKSSKTIDRTLSSISKQSFDDFEVIVIDDASEDFLLLETVIKKYTKSGLNIKIIHFEENKNGAAARNTGIKAARGKFIAFLDSDDEWLSTKLEIYREEILKNSSEKNIFYSQIKLVSDGKETNKIYPKNEIKAEQSAALYIFGFAGFIQTSTIVLSRHDANNLLFNENYKRHQDYDFCVRASALGYKFIMINEALTLYHINHNVNESRKKESISYSEFWLKDMSNYLTSIEKNCFKAYILPFKYLNEGDRVGAFRVFITNAPKTGIKVLLFNVANTLNKICDRLTKK